MIPLSYASIAGEACTLIGTSTNLVVNGLYRDWLEGPGLGLFEMAWVGLPVVATVIIYMLTAEHWLLPRRESATISYQDVRQYTQARKPPSESLLCGSSTLGFLPPRREDRSRGALSQPLQRRDHSSGA